MACKTVGTSAGSGLVAMVTNCQSVGVSAGPVE